MKNSKVIVLPLVSEVNEHIFAITALKISWPINAHCFTSSNKSGRYWFTLIGTILSFKLGSLISHLFTSIYL